MPETESNLRTFADKTIVVTGSSSGIGRAIALAFAELGADLILHGRSESSHLLNVKKEVESLGVKANLVTGDFLEIEDFSPFVDRCWAWKDQVDAWVNNAGIDVLTGAATEWTFSEKFDAAWRADVRSTLLLSRLAGQKMMAQKLAASPSAIINIGWDQAAHGMEGESGEMFAATKGAIMAMTKSLAKSLAPKVRVNCIAPGWIKTKWGDEATDKWQDRAVGESLMNRWGTPEDIAAAATFLASESASFISGQILPVNGGFRFRK